MGFYKSFENYCKKHSLFTQDDKILLAVSGGVDSMVMLDLFKYSNLQVGIAHCNFQLRDKDSDHDELFVTNEAKRLGIDCYSKKFKTKVYSGENVVSIQMAARELRYTWFEELRQKKGYSLVATAHNLDDSLETVLFNLTKGTGIAGLKGIPIKTGNIIRPLLFAQKQEILSYANKNGLKWRTDISNIDNKYARNLIRNKVIPVLKKINPKILDTFSNTTDKINVVSSLFVKWIESMRSDAVENRGEDIFIAKSKILDWEINARELILFEIIRLYGFNYNQAKNVCTSIDEIGKLFISETHHLNIDRDLIIISKIPDINTRVIIEKGDQLIELNGSNIVMEVHDKKINIEPDVNVAYLDLDDLVFPLVIRNWLEGDSFVPLGMKGEKKLSDFMIDEKIPLNLKSRVLVVTSAGNIVWIVGHRIDDRYKITENTTRTCRLKFLASS